MSSPTAFEGWVQRRYGDAVANAATLHPKWRVLTLAVRSGAAGAPPHGGGATEILLTYRHDAVRAGSANETPLFKHAAVEWVAVDRVSLMLTPHLGLLAYQSTAALAHAHSAAPATVPALSPAPPVWATRCHWASLAVLPVGSPAGGTAMTAVTVGATAEDWLRLARALRDAGAAVAGLDGVPSAVGRALAPAAAAAAAVATARVDRAVSMAASAATAIAGTDASGTLGAAVDVAASLLEGLQDAPFGVGTIARVVLLVKDGLDAVAGLDSSVADFRSRIVSCTLALNDIKELTHACPPVPSLAAWLSRLTAALTDATNTLGGVLGAWMDVDRPTWRAWFTKAARAAVYAKDIGTLTTTLGSAWTELGPALSLQAFAAQAVLLNEVTDRITLALERLPAATRDELRSQLDAVGDGITGLRSELAAGFDASRAATEDVGATLQLLASRLDRMERESQRALTSTLAPPPIDGAAYAAVVIRRYDTVQGLDQLSPEGTAYDDVKLCSVFIPQNVRELRLHPRLLDIPKDVLQAMQVQGEGHAGGGHAGDGANGVLHGVAGTLDEEVARQVRELHDAPVRPVLTALQEHRSVVVLGDPGAGKSSLLRYLLLSWAGRPPAERSEAPFPFIVELGKLGRTYAPTQGPPDLVAHLSASGGALNYPLPSGAVRAQLGSADAAPSPAPSASVYFDALDEVCDDRARGAVADAIATFAAAHPQLRVVVTSRIVGYNPAPFRGSGFVTLLLQDLDAPQVDSFLVKWHVETWARAQEERRRAKLASMRHSIATSPAIRTLAGNPLVLTMMALLNRHMPELPRQRHRLYAECANVLLGRWNVDVQLARIERLAEYKDHFDNPQKAALLRRLAREMQTRTSGASDGGGLGNLISSDRLGAVFEEELRDVTGFPRGVCKSISAAIVQQLHERNFILSFVGGTSYAFLHRTFLEYYCAADIKHRFEAKRELALADLRAIFDAHCDDPSWAEVLRLLCSMLEPEFAGACLRTIAPRAPLLTARCIDELASTHNLSAPPSAPASAVAADEERRKAVAAALHTPHPHEGTEYLPVAALVLSALWATHANTLPLLCDVARADGLGRWAATAALVRGWREHELTRPALIDVATSFDAYAVPVAVSALAETWPECADAYAAVRTVALSGTLLAGAAVSAMGAHLHAHGDTRALLERIALAGRWGAPEAVWSVVRPPAPAPPAWQGRIVPSALGGAEAAVAVLATRWRDDAMFATLCEVATTGNSGAEAAVRCLEQGWPAHHKLHALLLRVSASGRFGGAAAVVALATRFRADATTLPHLLEAARAGVQRTSDTALQALADGWGDRPETFDTLQAVAASHAYGAGTAVQLLAARYRADERVYPFVCRLATAATPGADAAVSSLAAAWGDAPGTRRVLRDVAHSDSAAAGTAVTLLWRDDAQRTAFDALCAVGRAGLSGAPAAVNVLLGQWRHVPETVHVILEIAGSQHAAASAAAIDALVRGWVRTRLTHDVVRLVATRGDGASETATTALAAVYTDQPDTLPLLLEIAGSGQLGAAAAVSELASTCKDHPNVLPLLRRVAAADAYAADTAVDALASVWHTKPETRELLQSVARSDKLGAAAAVRAIASRWREHRDTLRLLSAVSRSSKRGAATAKAVLAAWRDER